MLEHPGNELQVLIKEKGLTQKAFASILGKKVSELNELLKGKRNITIQRDYLLHQTLGTPIKYWILKQVDYDYSLLDIEESDTSSFGTEGRILGDNEQNHQDSSSQTPQNDNKTQNRHSEHSEESSPLDKEGLGEIGSHSEPEGRENPSNTKPMDFSLQSKGQPNTQDSNDSPLLIGESQGEVKPQKTPPQEPKIKDNEDYKKRARIFKSF